MFRSPTHLLRDITAVSCFVCTWSRLAWRQSSPDSDIPIRKSIKRLVPLSERPDLSQEPPQSWKLRCKESAMNLRTSQIVRHEMIGIIQKNLGFENPRHRTS